MEIIFDNTLLTAQFALIEDLAKNSTDEKEKFYLELDLKDITDKYVGLRDANLTAIQEDLFYEIESKFLINIHPISVSIVEDPMRIGAGDAILTTIPCDKAVDGGLLFLSHSRGTSL